MCKEKLLEKIKACLSEAYRERLCGVVLYGSEVRGDAASDSDIDVLVLLDGIVNYGKDLETNLEVLYPLSLQLGRRISAKPVIASEYEKANCPLYQNVHREGIRA
jgi:predicted nucleotidyltransferase